MNLFRLRIIIFLVCLGLGFSAQAKPLPFKWLQAGSADKQQSSQAQDPQQLSQSLDEVIEALEDDDKRQALVEQLKTLQKGLDETSPQKLQNKRGIFGIFNAVTTQFDDLKQGKKSGLDIFNLWRFLSHQAYIQAEVLINDTGQKALVFHVVQTIATLAVWLAIVLGLKFIMRRLYVRQGWTLYAPTRHHLRKVFRHIIRRILPWALGFIAMLSLLWLNVSEAAKLVTIIIAEAALAGSILASITEAVTALCSDGHRRIAAEIIRYKALRWLFVIGALMALGDTISGPRVGLAIGQYLSLWIAMVVSLLAGLLSLRLILKVRRAVTHLIRNQSFKKRHSRGNIAQLISWLANLWYIPALFFVAAPMIAALTTGGQTSGALAKAIICAAFLAIVLAASGVIGRYADQYDQSRKPKPEYKRRLVGFSFDLVTLILWLLFTEITLQVWGVSVTTIGGSSSLGRLISQTLFDLAMTVLIAWMAWVLLDAAILRALNSRTGRGRQRVNIRAQTVTPMIRNVTFFLIIIIAVITILSNLGVNITPLLAGAGVIGLAVGFGAQTLVQDLITGVFILIQDSLAVGDFVKIGGHMGSVEGLNLRTVRLRDLDGVLHIIAFSTIQSIHNMSRHFGTALLKIRIPYDLPIDDAIQLMKDTAEDLRKEPVIRHKVWSPIEMQGIHSFEDGCAVLRMRFRTAPEYQWDVGRAFNLLLKRRMEAQNIVFGAPRLSVSMEGQGGAHYQTPKASEHKKANTRDAGLPSDTHSGPTPDF